MPVTKPTPGGNTNTWGQILNDALDALDAAVVTAQTAATNAGVAATAAANAATSAAGVSATALSAANDATADAAQALDAAENALDNGIQQGQTRTITDLTNDKLLRIEITDDATDSDFWPDRLAFYFDGQRTGYHNEYGEVRARPARDSTVALRALGHIDNPSTNIFEVSRYDQANKILEVSRDAIIASVPIDASNLGYPIKAVQSTAPSTTDWDPNWFWLDTSAESTSVGGTLRRWTGSVFLPTPSAPPPVSTPTFVGAFSAYSNTGNTVTANLPTVLNGDLAVAFAIFNDSDETGVLGGAGWTAIIDDTAVAASMQYLSVRTLLSSDTTVNLTTSGVGGKMAIVGAVYRGAIYDTSDIWTPSSSTVTWQAPDVTALANSRIVRGYLEKSSTNTSWSSPTGHTQRITQFGTGGSAVSGSVADKEVLVSGAVGTATSTKNVSSQVGSAITVVLRGV